MTSTKENTLHLIIEQGRFDDIMIGAQKQEIREIKKTNYEKFLETWSPGGDETGINYDKSKMSKEDAHKYANEPMVYNDGVYPYIPINYKFLHLAAGYQDERDTMIVAVDKIDFETMKDKDGKEDRFSNEDERIRIDENGDLCIWQIVYNLGAIVETELMKDRKIKREPNRTSKQ